MNFLYEFIDFEKHSSAAAFVEHTVFRKRVFTYRDIESGIASVSVAFEKMGIHAGDRIILQGQNSARWAITFYAAIFNGVVVVPIDPSFSAEYRERIRATTEAKLVLLDTNGSDWNRLLEEPAGMRSSKRPEIRPDSLMQIIFTSGTTSEPKGVMITHGNVLANLNPVHREIGKYRKYFRLVSPLGFVHVIPLSHLFGQIMGLFIPQILGGKVIFSETAAARVIEAAKENRASVLVCVPRELELIRSEVERRFAPAIPPVQTKGYRGWVLRWFRFRKIHRRFGFKFWAFISGGATLPSDLEQFWRSLGFAVIQGYGLTETAPSITITHPLKMKQGSVGRILPGVEVKIADDGEILVRGANVTSGYYRNEKQTDEMFEDGWLHTGDIGYVDEERSLILKGRKKDVIVTSEGLNVYPDDVEQMLNLHPAVVESAVIANEDQGRTSVHAVMILKPDEDAAAVISETNQRLEEYQKIKSFSIWQEPSLPRTPTGKIMRRALRGDRPSQQQIEDLPARISEMVLAGSAQPADRLEKDLGLSSLDRVELLVELENATGTKIDENAFARARTLSEIQALVEKDASAPDIRDTYPDWRWPLWWNTRAFRFLMTYLLIFPALSRRVRVISSGFIEGSAPALFVSNHQSVLDVPVILRALPRSRRHKIAPAMGTRPRSQMVAAALFFNSYPLPQTSLGLKEALAHTGYLADCGYSPLVFPEGARTKTGDLQPFRPGIGVIAQHVKLPVIPVVIQGAYEIWPIDAKGPRGKGDVHVTFGEKLDFSGASPQEITSSLEIWFRDHYRPSGLASQREQASLKA